MFLSLVHQVGTLQQNGTLSIVCLVIGAIFIIGGTVLIFSSQPLAATIAAAAGLFFVLLYYAFKPKQMVQKVSAFFHKAFHGLFGKRIS